MKGIPIAIILAVAVLGIGGYVVISKRTQTPAPTPAGQSVPAASEAEPNQDQKIGNATAPTVQPQSPAPQPSAHEEGSAPNQSFWSSLLPKQGLFGQSCTGEGSQRLATFPLDPGNIELVVPMGRVQDSHVTPTDHQYVIPMGTQSGSLVTDNPTKYPIKAPVDGYIISIELFREPVEEQYRSQAYRDNYLVIFEHSCTFYTRLIHIDMLSEKVLASFSFDDPSSQHPYAKARIPVKEGEVIGTVGPHSFDFQIMDTTVKEKNLISPGNIDFFSAYTVNTFDYLTPALHAALLAKNMVKSAPLGGKIGYDIDGRLVGNWFLVGRNKNQPDYWTNNLSIVYDHLDPTQIRVSFGNFSGYPKAFGVRGNAPDPAGVSKSSGAIKYELLAFDYYAGGKRWDTLHYADSVSAANTSDLKGTVLFQLIEDRKLKVEIFPGKAASEVAGFTAAAKLYER
ncbi:MAG: hypothetical protein Q8R35_01925 [bacterium]|nr:hypothetical protein [bacterium]